MTKAGKLMLTASTALLVVVSLTGCSVSFEDPSASPKATSSQQPGETGSSATPSPTAPGTVDPEALVIETPKPLPTINAGDKPTYADPTVSSSLSAIIDNSIALADTDGWHANVNGKVLGAIPGAKSLANNSTYVIAPLSIYPAGKAADLPSGMTPTSLVLVTASQKYNAFGNLLGILNPKGGTLPTFDAKQSPLSDALFLAAGQAPSVKAVKPTDVQYGTSKSFGKCTARQRTLTALS